MVSKIIYLNNMNFSYRADSIWIDWEKKYNNGLIEYTKKQVALICLRNKVTQTEVVHPITEFIYNNWKYHSYNTQRKHALSVCSFLNFILSKKLEYSISSLLDLEIKHAEQYLNMLRREGRARDTVKDTGRTLTLFYLFLFNNDCLPKVPNSCFKSYINTEGKEIFISPFKNVLLPNSNSTTIEHTFPLDYLPLLFEIACLIAKPIVLGLYLQIFGGLRVGEVVNIKKSSIKHKINGESILLNIKEQLFRTDIKDLDGSNYVKKNRKQQVFIIKEWFDALYDDHISLYKSNDESGALFVNRDGKAMSSKSYRQYFEKVKKYFIQILRESDDIENKLLAHHLSMAKWSTHIGRGIFTNMLAEIAENPYDIAVPRGDFSILSSLTYLKGTKRFKEKLEDRINHMHTTYVPRLIQHSIEDTDHD